MIILLDLNIHKIKEGGGKKMDRVFNRNMFVMLLSIMVGAIIITYFAADIISRSGWEQRETGYKKEIKNIKGQSENFTSLFLKSSVILDQAREDRALGNYHFELGSLWYYSALSVKNNTTMDSYKIRGIDNCTFAMPNYINSNLNFKEAKQYFIRAKNYTNYEKYQNVLDLYVDLTESGSVLTMLRYNASMYLECLIENLTFNYDTYNVSYLENVSELLDLFNMTMMGYGMAAGEYEEILDEIDEYEFFDEIR